MKSMQKPCQYALAKMSTPRRWREEGRKRDGKKKNVSAEKWMTLFTVRVMGTDQKCQEFHGSRAWRREEDEQERVEGGGVSNSWECCAWEI